MRNVMTNDWENGKENKEGTEWRLMMGRRGYGGSGRGGVYGPFIVSNIYISLNPAMSSDFTPLVTKILKSPCGPVGGWSPERHEVRG